MKKILIFLSFAFFACIISCNHGAAVGNGNGLSSTQKKLTEAEQQQIINELGTATTATYPSNINQLSPETKTQINDIKTKITRVADSSLTATDLDTAKINVYKSEYCYTYDDCANFKKAQSPKDDIFQSEEIKNIQNNTFYFVTVTKNNNDTYFIIRDTRDTNGQKIERLASIGMLSNNLYVSTMNQRDTRSSVEEQEIYTITITRMQGKFIPILIQNNTLFPNIILDEQKDVIAKVTSDYYEVMECYAKRDSKTYTISSQYILDIKKLFFHCNEIQSDFFTTVPIDGKKVLKDRRNRFYIESGDGNYERQYNGKTIDKLQIISNQKNLIKFFGLD